jgi:hypothetical protein
MLNLWQADCQHSSKCRHRFTGAIAASLSSARDQSVRSKASSSDPGASQMLVARHPSADRVRVAWRPAVKRSGQPAEQRSGLATVASGA